LYLIIGHVLYITYYMNYVLLAYTSYT